MTEQIALPASHPRPFESLVRAIAGKTRTRASPRSAAGVRFSSDTGIDENTKVPPPFGKTNPTAKNRMISTVTDLPEIALILRHMP